MRSLFQIAALLCLMVTSQVFSQDKPKAILFEELQNISRAEMKKRVEKFDERLRKDAWSENYVDGVVFFYSPNEKSFKSDSDFIGHILSDNCRDCRGWSSRLTFVNVGKGKMRKIQLWVVPRGADLPTIEK